MLSKVIQDNRGIGKAQTPTRLPLDPHNYLSTKTTPIIENQNVGVMVGDDKNCLHPNHKSCIQLPNCLCMIGGLIK